MVGGEDDGEKEVKSLNAITGKECLVRDLLVGAVAVAVAVRQAQLERKQSTSLSRRCPSSQSGLPAGIRQGTP